MMRFKYTTLVPQKCEVCESRNGLLRCSGCSVAYYCGRDHQTVHRNTHKRACVTTKKARMAFSEADVSLRNSPADGFMHPPRVFEDYAGRFWGLVGTRDYMRARFKFAQTLLTQFPHHQVAVQTALDHFMDVLRLNRSDNMGLRDKVPALMLRLGRDQDAYDFVKWWATCDPDGSYNWGDMGLPYLDTRAADILEEPRWWTGRFMELSHAAVVMLIKLRVLLKLRDLQNTARALQASTLPCEIVNQVREEVLGDSPLAGRRDLAVADTATVAAMLERVRKQIWTLYFAVEDANMHFWPDLIGVQDDDEELQTPEAYTAGSPEQAQLTILYNYPAWEETPAALDELEIVWHIHVGKVVSAHRHEFYDEEDGGGPHAAYDFFYD